MKLVMASKERVVKAERVLRAGPQPAPVMETTLITLMHLVLHSEKVELEVRISSFQLTLKGLNINSHRGVVE